MRTSLPSLRTSVCPLPRQAYGWQRLLLVTTDLYIQRFTAYITPRLALLPGASVNSGGASRYWRGTAHLPRRGRKSFCKRLAKMFLRWLAHRHACFPLPGAALLPAALLQRHTPRSAPTKAREHRTPAHGFVYLLYLLRCLDRIGSDHTRVLLPTAWRAPAYATCHHTPYRHRQHNATAAARWR